jgi:hypothetical protein
MYYLDGTSGRVSRICGAYSNIGSKYRLHVRSHLTSTRYCEIVGVLERNDHEFSYRLLIVTPHLWYTKSHNPQRHQYSEK